MRLLTLEQILYNVPAIIIGFTVHEFMHAYVADRLGDPTPRMNGRLTLNPIVHIDWVGFIMVILLGFGWAKPVRINPRNFANRRKSRIMVSIAGPLANLAFAFFTYAILFFSRGALFGNEIVLNFIYSIITINLMLFAFNILPIPPLDGYNILEELIHYSKYQTLAKLRQYGFIILIVLSIVGVLGMYISLATRSAMTLFTWVFTGISWLVGLI